MNAPVVFIVDDDAIVRDSLAIMLESAGLEVAQFACGEAFLTAYQDTWTGCMVLDLQLGDMSGTELQTALIERACKLPIIFLTAHGDIPTTVRAVKRGAMDFLTKPVNGALLIERVQTALAHNKLEVEREHAVRADHERLAQLTAREREILHLALAGRANKEIARDLGISHRTVEFHRSRILFKTGASSLLQLAQITLHDASPPADIPPPPSTGSDSDTR